MDLIKMLELTAECRRACDHQRCGGVHRRLARLRFDADRTARCPSVAMYMLSLADTIPVVTNRVRLDRSVQEQKATPAPLPQPIQNTAGGAGASIS